MNLELWKAWPESKSNIQHTHCLCKQFSMVSYRGRATLSHECAGSTRVRPRLHRKPVWYSACTVLPVCRWYWRPVTKPISPKARQHTCDASGLACHQTIHLLVFLLIHKKRNMVIIFIAPADNNTSANLQILQTTWRLNEMILHHWASGLPLQLNTTTHSQVFCPRVPPPSSQRRNRSRIGSSILKVKKRLSIYL